MTQIKPVRHRVIPRYPTHDYLEQHPELLSIVPQRWLQNPFVLRILGGTVCLILAGQPSAFGQQAAGPASSRIAPLFLHGEGRGAFGCIVVNPPVFLTEDEARQVIQEEAKKAGLTFSPDAFTIRDATVPVTDLYSCGSFVPRPKIQAKEEKRDLQLDGFDQKYRVGYEFVSGEDYIAWQRKNPGCMSSVSSFDLRGVAAGLRDGFPADSRLPWLGVFYEPAAVPPEISRNAGDKDWKAAWEDRRKIGREIGADELRKQVRDFIEWLRAQGVI